MADAFLPQVPSDGSTAWLPVARITDRSDPKLAHLDGLNLSRAWMLEGIAKGLPADDKRRAALQETARLHTQTSLGAVTSEHYVGSHWLGTFALYGASIASQLAPALLARLLRKWQDPPPTEILRQPPSAVWAFQASNEEPKMLRMQTGTGSA